MKNVNSAAQGVTIAAVAMLMSFMLSTGANASDQQAHQVESYQPNNHGHQRPKRRNRVTVVEGYVSHGVNVFNDEFMVDYSAAAPNVPFLMSSPPLYEIGVLDPGAIESEIITAQTNKNRLVATNGRFVELFGLPRVDELYNVPLDQVQSTFFGSSSILDRVLPLQFDQAGEQQVYRRTNTNQRPTLKEWNEISGQISFSCNGNDSAKVKISIANAFPNAIYTMWDVGASNPLTAQEAPYAVPLGGLPNTLITDDNGCATTTLDVPYCPGRECAAGAASCTSYLSIAHHWDQQTYGAAPGGSFYGVPIGAFTANHMVWPMSGIALQPPSTKWTKRLARRTCR